MSGVAVFVLTPPLPRPQKGLGCIEMLALAEIVREGGRLEDAETRLLLQHLEDCERCKLAACSN